MIYFGVFLGYISDSGITAMGLSENMIACGVSYVGVCVKNSGGNLLKNQLPINYD